MVLFTHSVVGGALGSLLKSHPVLAFFAGFISHFILDAFPHWDYTLESGQKHESGNELKGDFVIDHRFLFDLVKIGTDLLVGAVIVYLFFVDNILDPILFLQSGMFWGMVGGILPDFLQFAYYKTKREPLTTLQKFHISVHTNVRLKDRYIIGPLLQIALVLLVLFVF
mgnify:CR=1 FL=1